MRPFAHQVWALCPRGQQGFHSSCLTLMPRPLLARGRHHEDFSLSFQHPLYSTRLAQRRGFGILGWGRCVRAPEPFLPLQTCARKNLPLECSHVAAGGDWRAHVREYASAGLPRLRNAPAWAPCPCRAPGTRRSSSTGWISTGSCNGQRGTCSRTPAAVEDCGWRSAHSKNMARKVRVLSSAKRRE